MTVKYRRIIESVFNQPWLMDPTKMREILTLLELQSDGQKLSPDEVQARIAGRRESAVTTGNGIGVLSLYGVMDYRAAGMMRASGGVSVEAFMDEFKAMAANDEVGTIVLRIDSPGGSVAGVQEAGDLIDACGKRVIAVCDPYAASAAYWLASQADEVVITPSGMAGSIGVYSVHTDASEAYAKDGIEHTVIRAGKFKAEGLFEPLSEEAVEARQESVNTTYQAFIAAVARGRGVDSQVVIDQMGQGRVVDAVKAVEMGMADRIATFDEVINQLRAESRSRRRESEPAFALGVQNMDKKIFEALVRQNLCGIDASDEVAQAALTAFFSARGIDVPEAADGVVAELNRKPTTQVLTSVVGTLESTVADASVDDSRVEDIYAAVELAGIDNPMQVARELVAESGLTTHAALQRIRDMASEANPPAGTTRIEAGDDARDKFVTAARDALLVRTFGGQLPSQIHDRATDEFIDWKPTAGSRTNYGLGRLPRLAEECLRISGYSSQQIAKLAPYQIAQLAMGVTDPQSLGIYGASDGPAYNVSGMFSNLLLDASNVSLRKSYAEANTTYQAWMKQGPSVADFKTVNKVIAGELADPKAIPEDGQFEESTIADGKETYSLTTWGEVFSITWQSVVNDQLGAFTEIPAKQGKAMRRKQNKLAYGVLLDNAALATTTGALFNATAVTTTGGHNNLVTGAAGAPSATTLNLLSRKMQEQRGLNITAETFLNLWPKFIIAPPAIRGTIMELLGSRAAPASSGNSGITNIWENELVPVFDAQIGTLGGGLDTAWYLAADPMDIDTIEYAFLQGLETPALEQERAFDRLAIRYRIYQAFAVKALDYRGLQKHNGA